MKLYAIKDVYNEVILIEIEVTKETANRYILEDNRTCRSYINKNELYKKYYDTMMFGTDKELLIELWNKSVEEKILSYERKIEKLKRIKIV